jgi:solute carrier family 41
MDEPSSLQDNNVDRSSVLESPSRQERIEIQDFRANHVEDDSGIEENGEQGLLHRYKSEEENSELGFKNFLSSLMPKATAAIQIIFPFLVAGLGCVFAGMLLDKVEHWPLYTDVTELYILVPSLLGLKGNLEMTLSSRLSTAANLGHLDEKKKLLKLVFGNMALMQGQVLIVSASSAVFALVLDWIADGDFCLIHAVIIPVASLTTASIASAVLGTVMVIIIVLSRKLNINPDNVATPIAASLGDLVTLALLSYTSQMIYQLFLYSGPGAIVLSVVILLFFLLLLPLWLGIAYKNEFTKSVVFSGLHPVFIAMGISR